MSDPNLNDDADTAASAVESAEDEHGIVEAADSVQPDRAEAADAGTPAEESAAAEESAEAGDTADSADSDDDA
ncbi:MAG TPA: transcription termination/antitermination protein NusG, partial [Streptomyces sp.]